MGISVGIDIGSTTLKIASIDNNENLKPISIKFLLGDRPLAETLLEAFLSYTDNYGQDVDYIGITGSGQRLGAAVLGSCCTATEIIAHAKGSCFLAKKLNLPVPKTIIEIGGQDSKLIKLENEIPTFFNMNSICSAGTGEFLRHTIEEQSLSFEEFNRYVLEAQEGENLEDICTVFARRSFRHAGQRGTPLDRRLKGLAYAILKNYLRTVAKDNGSGLKTPIFFLGGLSNCSSLALTLAELLEKPIFVPPYSQGIGAIGMAVLASERKEKLKIQLTNNLFETEFAQNLSVESGYCLGCVNNCELTVVNSKYLSDENNQKFYIGGRCEGAGRAKISKTVTIPRPLVRKATLEKRLELPLPTNKDWAIGIDAGSRQLKAALLFGDELIKLHTEIIEADIFNQALKAISFLESYLPETNTSYFLKTTGSGGRFLSQKLVGDESLYETEILTHYRTAYIHYPRVGTVIDVGGNDSKIIITSSSNLDFAMNDRCAAGTGSFLEQLAKRFDQSLEEAAFLALKSENPARIGSRCAVLAETDIIHKMRSGAKPEDLLLGACYALARTFISDTLHGKTLITPVVFQGGAFLNPALLLAFTDLLNLKEDEYFTNKDKRYLVGAGAIGAASYALESGKQFYKERKVNQYSLAGGNG